MHTMLVFMKAAAAFPFHTGYHVTGYSEKAFYLKFVKQKEIPGFLLRHCFPPQGSSVKYPCLVSRQAVG